MYLVHLGGNDLGLLKGKALVLQTREDFQVTVKKIGRSDHYLVGHGT